MQDLLDCTLRFLIYLLKQVRTKGLSYEDFCFHARIKVTFLKDFIYLIDASYKEYATEVIEECETIMSCQNYPYWCKHKTR